MRSNAIEDGWQRFLDRLRRLWGQRRRGGFIKPHVNAAVAWFQRTGATAPMDSGSVTSTMWPRLRAS